MNQQRFRWATAVVAALAIVATATPAHADVPVIGGPPPGIDQTVQLVNGPSYDELCLSPAGGSSAVNAAVVQYYCDADPARLFELLTRPDGHVELYDESSRLCLSPAGGSTAAGTPLVQYYCDSDPARGWTVFPTDDAAGTVLIQNEHSKLCISVDGGRGANAQVTQAPCNYVYAMQWVVSSQQVIGALGRGWCLGSSSYALNATVVAAGCSSYRFTMDTTGYYLIRDVDKQLCLSPAGGSTARNATIVQYYCDGDPSRHWVVARVGAGYQIWNVHSGLCLTPAGGSTDWGVPVVQYTCDGDPSRFWTFISGPYKL